MKICSFLPSATEILYALGLGDSICGVTFECDYPAEARTKPVVVYSKFPTAYLRKRLTGRSTTTRVAVKACIASMSRSSGKCSLM